MRTALQHAFDCDEHTMTVAFYKYGVRLHGHTYRKHIHAISVTFATAQLCHAKLAQFVAGNIDVSRIGDACTASLDEYKARATALYRKYRTRMQEMKRDVDLVDDNDGDDDADDEDSHSAKDKEKEKESGGVCSLPMPVSPLQFFKRPKVVKSPPPRQAPAQPSQPQAPTVTTSSQFTGHNHHTRSMAPKQRSFSNAENGALLKMGNTSSGEFEKIPKKIEKRISLIKQEKEKERQKQKQKEKEEVSEPPLKRRKLRANDAVLSRKKKLVTVTSSLIKTEDKPAHKHALLSLQKKAMDDAKKMSTKIRVGGKTQAATATSTATTTTTSQSQIPTQTKPRSKLWRDKRTKMALKRIKSPSRSADDDDDDVDVDVAMKDQNGGVRNSWRTYLSLYAMHGNRESLARLHFECVQTFKQQLMEQCVYAEYQRIMRAHDTAKKKKRKQPTTTTTTVTGGTHVSKVETESLDTHTLSSKMNHNTTGDDALTSSASSSSSDKKPMLKSNHDDTLKTPQSPPTQPLPATAAADINNQHNHNHNSNALFLGLHFNQHNHNHTHNTSTSLPFMSIPSSTLFNHHTHNAQPQPQPPPPTIASTVMANKTTLPLVSSHSMYSELSHGHGHTPLSMAMSRPNGPLSVAYARDHSTATATGTAVLPASHHYVYPTPSSNAMYTSMTYAPFTHSHYTSVDHRHDQHTLTDQKLPLPMSDLDALSFNFMLPNVNNNTNLSSSCTTAQPHSLKMAAPLPHFDLAAATMTTASKHYSDTVSSLSNTSNATNLTACSSMAPSLTSFASNMPFVSLPSSSTAPAMAIKSDAHKRTPQSLPLSTTRTKTETLKTVTITDDSDNDTTTTDRLESDIISKNGQWIIRSHSSGCARTQGHYTLSPVNKHKKFRHLGHSHARAASSESLSSIHSGGNARHLRANQRRLRLTMKESHTHGHTASLTASKMNALRCRPKNIQFGKSSIHSWGVFALEEIAAEEMVVEYIGEYIQEKVANLREKLYAKQGYDDYMFRVDDHLIIDATKKGNLARFINHSCDPNCYTRVVHVQNTPRIVIFSKRKIKPGEELTYDYKFPIEEDKIPCLCGSKNCRGTLN